MNIELYKEAVLTIDIPDERLKAGDVGTVVEILPHPTAGPRGAILEVFSAVGNTLAVVTVPESAIEPLSDDESMAGAKVGEDRVIALTRRKQFNDNYQNQKSSRSLEQAKPQEKIDETLAGANSFGKIGGEEGGAEVSESDRQHARGGEGATKSAGEITDVSPANSWKISDSLLLH